MLDAIIGWSIRRRWCVLLAGLGFALWGVYAVSQTPMDAVPDLSENQVLVQAAWPGHGPRDIDEHITSPLTAHLSGVSGVRVVRGSSDIDSSLVHVIFEDGVGFAAARDRVQEQLGAGSHLLPAGVTARLAPDAIPTGQIFWYTVEGRGFDLARLRALQEWVVAPQLRSVPGVAEIASVGGFLAEYQIDLDPERLRHLRVRLADVARVLEQIQAPVAGHVLHKSNAEYVTNIRSPLTDTAGLSDSEIVRHLESLVIPAEGERFVPMGDVARIHVGVQSRRGVLEKDGNEVAGGVAMLRHGHNPLIVTRALLDKLAQVQAGLPEGVRVIPCYDRTPLIEGAVRTVTGTLMEAVVTSCLCVLVVLLHARASLVIAVSIPLAALGSFIVIWCLRVTGAADVQTNIMSLAGIAISIGVLVDSSIVIVENVMHRLHQEFGDRPVTGDVRELVRQACSAVGRPIFFSILIMLVSFLPVFALSGMDGKMFQPLALTKTFALLAVAGMSVTLIPALCTFLIRGRLRPESHSWLVRSVGAVYRPVLEAVLLNPVPLIWLLAVTFILGTAPLGLPGIFLGVLALAMIVVGMLIQRTGARIVSLCSLVIVALTAQQVMTPLGTEVRMPLNEGMVMDMPITIPRASVTQSGDDVRARDMQLCRFPEVHMVIGKAGRIESAFDPAPLDMIETMVEFRPRAWWPRRHLRPADARWHTARVLDEMRTARLLGTSPDTTDSAVRDEALMLATQRCDAVLREFVHQRHQDFLRSHGRTLAHQACRLLLDRLEQVGTFKAPLAPVDRQTIAESLPPETAQQLAMSPTGLELQLLWRQVLRQVQERGLVRSEESPPLDQATTLQWLARHLLTLHQTRWKSQVSMVDHELLQRVPEVFTRVVAEELARKLPVTDPALRDVLSQIEASRRPRPLGTGALITVVADAASVGADPGGIRHAATEIAAPVLIGGQIPATHHAGRRGPLPWIDPHEVWDPLRAKLVAGLAGRMILIPCDPNELGTFGGELDLALQMPGWTNVWTKPIQNRVDMLATGVNTEIGVRVLGADLDAVVQASEDIARVLRTVPGAADVVADPIRGKGYLDVRLDLERAGRSGVTIPELRQAVGLALGGLRAGTIQVGREPRPLRLRFSREWTDNEDVLADLPLPVGPATSPGQPPLRLGDVATIGITEGPATIKREQGWLRNYVRLNVRDRDVLEFLSAARGAVSDRVRLPPGVFIEWTGQFEHTVATLNTLTWIMPLVVGLILLILYATYGEWTDAWMMLVAVPGALAGGVLFQWFFGYRFSIPVAIGYIACFGMATSTGIIMLVYLREAVARAGGVARLTPETLRQAVMDGAVHRLRPKLLTEGTTILGLAPMLWASGVGSEVIRPMAAPVLGGILLADEVVDLLLPVLFYWSRLRRLPAPSGDGAGCSLEPAKHAIQAPVESIPSPLNPE